MSKKNEQPILVVSLNPTIQKTLVHDSMEIGGVNRSNEYIFTVGGKGANASRVIKQLGHEPIYLTQAGGYMRTFFLEKMKEDGVRTEWVESNSEIRFCYTLINREPFTATEIVENGMPVDKETNRRVRNRYQKLLPKCGALIIAGSKTAGFSADIYLDMIEEAVAQDKTVVIDLAGGELLAALKFSPQVVKINMFEFISTFIRDAKLPDQKVQDKWYPQITERAKEIYIESGTRFVLSNGNSDILVIDGQKISKITPSRVKTVNPIGSGDAFTGGLTAGLIEHLSLHNAAEKGMDCAGRNLKLLKTGTIR